MATDKNIYLEPTGEVDYFGDIPDQPVTQEGNTINYFADEDNQYQSAIQGLQKTTSDGSSLMKFKPPMGEFEATEADWLDQLKLAAGMMFTFDEQERINMIKNTLPEANIRMDDGGNAIVSYRGEEGYVNKPGVSWRDFASVAGTLLAFTPAFRTAQYASTIAGKAALVGAANSMTEAALQGTVEVLEGTRGKGLDAEQVLIAGVLGGGSIAAVDKVSKIVAPMIKARGVKKAKKIVDDISVRIRKYERQNLNPQEAFDRAIRDSGWSTDEAVGLAHKAGKPIKPATAAQEAAFDARISNKLKAAFNTQPVLKEGMSLASKAFVPVLTRIDKMSPKIAGSLRKFMHNVHKELIETEDRVDSFLTGMRKMKSKHPGDYRDLKKALINGDINTFDKMVANMAGDIPELRTAVDDMRIVLDEVGDYLVATKSIQEKIGGFFPRIVRDYRTLAQTLTGKEYGKVSTAVLRAQEKARSGVKGRDLDAEEISSIVKKTLSEIRKGIGDQSRTTQRRTLGNISDDLVDHYMDPEEALEVYLSNFINKKNKQFFATSLTKSDELVPFHQNTDYTIKDLLERQITDGFVMAKDEASLTHLLDAVLTAGQKVQHGAITDIKNVFYMATLGNPLSAMTQLGDVAISAVLNGINNTAYSAIRSIRRGVNIPVRDVAVAMDRAAEEMASSTRATARALNSVLKYSGFQAVDRFGKRTFINAAHRKLQKQVRSGAKGISRFRDKYKNSFTEEELHNTITSLSNGTIDDNVKFVLWNELSGAQPLTMLEMPEAYLRSPNGRIFYMLKTFTLKQLDIMRRTAVDDIVAGRIAKGSKQLAYHNAMLLAAGVSVDTIKDIVRGRETDIGDKSVAQLYRNFGTSEYMFSDIGEGKISKALGKVVLPPVNVIDDVFSDIMHLGQQFNSFKHIPVVGSLLYNWFGGGLEEANERLEKRQNEE